MRIFSYIFFLLDAMLGSEYTVMNSYSLISWSPYFIEKRSLIEKDFRGNRKRWDLSKV